MVHVVGKYPPVESTMLWLMLLEQQSFSDVDVDDARWYNDQSSQHDSRHTRLPIESTSAVRSKP